MKIPYQGNRKAKRKSRRKAHYSSSKHITADIDGKKMQYRCTPREGIEYNKLLKLGTHKDVAFVMITQKLSLEEANASFEMGDETLPTFDDDNKVDFSGTSSSILPIVSIKANVNSQVISQNHEMFGFFDQTTMLVREVQNMKMEFAAKDEEFEKLTKNNFQLVHEKEAISTHNELHPCKEIASATEKAAKQC